MTEDELKQQYHNWLYSLVRSNHGGPENTALMAFRVLSSVEFYELVPNDYNRELEGKNLREEFWTELGDPSIAYVLEGPCTMAEMLIPLARRIAYMTDGLVEDSSTQRWFWEMVNNIGIFKSTDLFEPVLRVVERSYRTDGEGGLFPLASPSCDQRKIEIWQQANEYLLENYWSC